MRWRTVQGLHGIVSPWPAPIGKVTTFCQLSEGDLAAPLPPDLRQLSSRILNQKVWCQEWWSRLSSHGPSGMSFSETCLELENGVGSCFVSQTDVFEYSGKTTRYKRLGTFDSQCIVGGPGLSVPWIQAKHGPSAGESYGWKIQGSKPGSD